jgi:hypothetical protein
MESWLGTKARHSDDDVFSFAASTAAPCAAFIVEYENSSFPRDVSCEVVLISSNDVSEPVALSIIDGLCMKKFASLKRPSNLKSIAVGYISDDGRFMCFSMIDILSDGDVSEYARFFASFKPKVVVNFSGIHRALLVSSAASSLQQLKHVATSSLPPTTILLADAPKLEIGNVVTGLTAGMCNYCEVRDISFVALLSVRESSLTLESLSAFERAWSFLEGIFSSPLRKPTAAEYAAAMKRDKFVCNTANLYC